MQKKYFARANTSSGTVNLMKNNLDGIINIYSLSGSSKAAKSKLMERVGNYFAEALDTEFVFSPFDVSTIDAVIVRKIKFAMVDKDCIGKDIKAKKIDTDSFLNIAKLGAKKEHLNKLKLNADSAYEGLFKSYGEAKKIHDDWEKIYIDNMDFKRLESYSAGVINELFGEVKGTGRGLMYERFFGASVPDGSVNYINNLTEGLKKRYFIKGRPGTGKSTFLKKLAKEAMAKGFDIEVYYCSFDKNSLDMVVIPELSFCVFDSTAPHEMFPESERDSILDFYEESGLAGVDEKYEKELGMVSLKYKYRISEGLAHLRLGNLCEKEREFYMENIINDDMLAKMADKIVRKVTI